MTTRARIRASAVLLCALAVVTGCGASGAGSGSGATGSQPTSSPGSPSVLADRTFLSTTVTGHDLVAGTRVALTFKPAAITAQAGCNTMFGTLTLDADRMSVSDLGMTEMGCPSGLAEQDSWLSDFLTGGASWRVDGDRLTLTSGAVTIELLDRRVVDPDRPLQGTTWQLTGVIEGDSASSEPGDAADPALLTLSAGKLAVRNRCAQLHGGYRVDGDRLLVSALRLDRPDGCDAGRLEFVADVLEQGTTTAIEAGQLRLVAPDGRGLMLTEAT